MARHGIYEYFHTDGGRCYVSSSFQEFAAADGFSHVISSPKFPISNGMAERHVAIVKDLLKKADEPYLALLAFRSCPLSNGFSPAELYMGRKK